MRTRGNTLVERRRRKRRRRRGAGTRLGNNRLYCGGADTSFGIQQYHPWHTHACVMVCCDIPVSPFICCGGVFIPLKGFELNISQKLASETHVTTQDL